jgi:hypothetical protein
MTRWVWFGAAAMFAASALINGPAARAADRHFNVGSGLWSQAGSWNPAVVPGVLDNAIVDYFDTNTGTGGLARITVGAPTSSQTLSAVSTVSISNSANVRITNLGSLLCGGDFNVGNANTLGILTLQTTSPTAAYFGGLSVGANLRLGVQSGVGLVNQSDGTVAVGGSVKIGDTSQSGSFFSSVGTYNLTGGTLRAQTIDVARDIYSSGTFNLSGGVASADNVNVGASSGTGVATQTGGSMTAKTQLIIGSNYSAGTYNLSGGTLSSIATTTYAPSGALNISGGTASLGDLVMWGGRITLTPGGSRSMRAHSIALNHPIYGSVIDLNDNRMVLDTDYYWLSYDLGRAYNGGGWDGDAGITSSVARAVAASGSPHRTGIGDMWTADGLVVAYTLMGDANLDHKVDLTDFTIVAKYFNEFVDGTELGDFNYDTKVDLTDFTLLASNFNQSLPAGSLAAGGASPGAPVPEPTGVITLIVAAVTSGYRRRAPTPALGRAGHATPWHGHS